MTEPNDSARREGEPLPQSGLPALTRLRLADLRRLDLAEEIAEVLKQVERPRVNLGGNGPPGRAD